MNRNPCSTCAWAIALGLAVLAYFVVFPGDLLAMIKPVLELCKAVLELTTVVSPWLYAVLMVGIVAWTVVRVWGGRASRPAQGP